jgi:hypothetical protein
VHVGVVLRDPLQHPGLPEQPDYLRYRPFGGSHHQSNQSAAGPGDSGGPVFELPNPDDGWAIAKGLISGGEPRTTPAPCTGVPRNRCSSTLYYADMTQTLAYYGATLLTA